MILALGIVYAVIGIITVSLVLLHSGRGGGAVRKQEGVYEALVGQ